MPAESSPEIWLTGPVSGVPALLQPVAHSLQQSRREVHETLARLTADQTWSAPHGLPAVGFHVRHAMGSLDRLLTYARGESLSSSQLHELERESDGTLSRRSTLELTTAFDERIERSLVQVQATSEDSLGDPRGVGRAGLPSTVIGLLMHAAEHTQRHMGQMVTTAKVALLLSAVLLASLPSVLCAQAVRHGFATDRLARIDRFLQQAVDSNRIAGAVGLVLRDGKMVYAHAAGWSDREARRRMRPDAIFRIASQSKAVTSVAILMLVEEGKLALTDPVSRTIPAFARTTVITRSDTGTSTSTVAARRQITIRDLLTHTAGISYGSDALVASQYASRGLGPGAGYGWYTADKDESVCTTMERLATLPFVSQPGTAWVYGYNTDILGCVVERASGMTLDEFVATRITGPLGMRDTHFFLPEAKRSRLVTVYASDSTSHAARAVAGARGQGDYLDGPRRNFSGGAGLVSTAHDYSRFLRMILNRGALDGRRYLSPKMVDLLTSNQTGTLYTRPGMGFSLAFQTVDRPGSDGLATAGTYGWAGAYGTVYKVDPAERLIIVFMMNQLPDRSDVMAKFPTLVYQALVSPYAEAATQRP